MNISFDSTENVFSIVKVYGLNGHLLSQRKEFTVNGQQTISIDIGSLSPGSYDIGSLSPGSYFIQLDNGKGRGVAKFIVQ